MTDQQLQAQGATRLIEIMNKNLKADPLFSAMPKLLLIESIGELKEQLEIEEKEYYNEASKVLFDDIDKKEADKKNYDEYDKRLKEAKLNKQLTK